jgi:glycosyltransferase involved in cell wall biosynthesis
VARVTAIVPSRNERFLVPTVKDLLSRAEGDIEVLVVLDGYWNHDLPADARLKILHHGQARGMRPAINAAVQMSTGRYLLKCDAHTMWDQGWDTKLQADYHEDNWVLTCRRYALDPEAWAIDTTNKKYPVDYHYLSFPFEREDDPTCGMHGTEWRARREERRDVLLDDEMSSQGSGWFMSRTHWDRTIGALDYANYGSFVQEFQEVGLKTWLSGGAVKVTKNTWYAHLYKGKKYGRGYTMADTNHQAGVVYTIEHWMHDRGRELRKLIEQFSPVPTWPSDLDEAFRNRRGLAAARFAKSASDGKRVA